MSREMHPAGHGIAKMLRRDYDKVRRHCANVTQSRKVKMVLNWPARELGV